MSKYTDILVRKETKDYLKKFADSKGITISDLLAHVCIMLERGKNSGHSKSDIPNIQELPKEELKND